ncbi:MAG: Mrp/NBP35 family ATP-binding protein [Phycisphaerales bacterium JB065]
MGLTKQHVLDALSSLQDATTTENLVSLGLVRKVAACDDFIALTVAAPEDEELRNRLHSDIHAAINEAAGQIGAEVKKLTVEFVVPTGEEKAEPQQTDDARQYVEQPKTIPLKQAASSHTTSAGKTQPGSPSMPGVKQIIAVGAGKGGVGKSTVSVNLAIGLARKGYAVGILDADIYGPSMPTLLGLDDIDVQLHQNMLQVMYVHGVKAMTIGKLVDPEKPLIWRGPMAHGAFKQLAEQTEWGELDYLIVDLPPGTGDVPLTMSQMLSVTGAVVVCTPQKVAQDDAVRAVRMFQQLKIEVLGIVENMSYFIGDDDKEYDIFGRGGAEIMAQRLGLPFLGAIPLNMALRQFSDAGTPRKNFTDAGETMKRSLEKMTDQIEVQAALAGNRVGSSRPTLTVS